MKGTGRPLQVVSVLDPDTREILGWMFWCRECGTSALGSRARMLDRAATHCPPPEPPPVRVARSFVDLFASWGAAPVQRDYGLARGGH